MLEQNWRPQSSTMENQTTTSSELNTSNCPKTNFYSQVLKFGRAIASLDGTKVATVLSLAEHGGGQSKRSNFKLISSSNNGEAVGGKWEH